MRNFPRILEINTWPWFHSFRRNRQVNSLEHISITDWQELTHNFDTIWLMGIWQRSETSKRIAQTHPGLLRDFQQALPDFQPVDIVGSPYAIKSYTLDPFFGPPSTLEKISQTFNQLEKKIIVDLIPNLRSPIHLNYYISSQLYKFGWKKMFISIPQKIFKIDLKAEQLGISETDLKKTISFVNNEMNEELGNHNPIKLKIDIFLEKPISNKSIDEINDKNFKINILN